MGQLRGVGAAEESKQRRGGGGGRGRGRGRGRYVDLTVLLSCRVLTSTLRTGYLISAGADALIHLFPLPPPSSSPDLPSSTDTSDPPIPTHTLAGHSHNVCAVNAAKDGRRIASASWDLTARVWEFREEGEKGEWECERVLVGHGGAVWDVLLLEKNDRLVLTGMLLPTSSRRCPC